MAPRHSNSPDPPKKKPKKPAKPYKVFNNLNSQHTLQPDPCAYCFYRKKPNCYILRRKGACERCAHRKQPCNFREKFVTPTWDPSPGEDPKEADSSDSLDNDSVTVRADSPAKNLRPRDTSSFKRARVPDSESEGNDGKGGSSSTKSPVLCHATTGLIQGRPEASGSSHQGPFSLPVHDEQQSVNSVQIGRGDFKRALEIKDKVNPIERRSLLARVDELGNESAEKCWVAVVEAEERLEAVKDREWQARRQAEVEERKVFGLNSQFCTVQLLGVIREELLDVDPKGNDSHDREVASILKIFASILEADDKVSVEGHPFLDGMLGQVYDRDVSIEDFEMGFVTRSFLETPRSKGKGKAKVSEVDRLWEEEDGMEKDQLEDDFSLELPGRS
ncbi:hypothetical protein P7C70_g8422, partial [Phenoliferia sp. Uapishka_3]